MMLVDLMYLINIKSFAKLTIISQVVHLDPNGQVNMADLHVDHDIW